MRTLTQTREGEAGFDASIARVAELQHGVVAREQLLGMGLERGAIGRRLRGKRLHQLHFGVYAVGHRVVSQRALWMAAVLACGDGTVLSHRSAAALWGIRSQQSGPIDVALPRKSRSSRVIRRHFLSLPIDEMTGVDGIPVTTFPRTIFDLAASERPAVVEAALRQAEYLRLSDPLSLPALLDRYPGHRGSRAIRAALNRFAESPGRIRSPLEERFLPFLDRHELPRPHLNAWIHLGTDSYQVDCLWTAARQIVELDSWEAHGTRPVFHSDRARDRHLRVAGYGVTRLTWDQLDDEPDRIAADLRALLRPPPTRAVTGVSQAPGSE
jgi:Protein of unknown function (DUF559)